MTQTGEKVSRVDTQGKALQAVGTARERSRGLRQGQIQGAQTTGQLGPCEGGVEGRGAEREEVEGTEPYQPWAGSLSGVGAHPEES